MNRISLTQFLCKIRNRTFLPIIVRALEEDSQNIARQRQRKALFETVHFVEKHMQSVPSFASWREVLHYSIAHAENTANGLILEFGVYRGGTLNYIADQLPKRTIYGFDSFEGLPGDWYDGRPKGTFKVTRLPRVRKNVKLIKGLFQETLNPFLQANSGDVSFIHIDSDLYSSAKTILTELERRIQPGTVITFDDYFNYPGWKNGEYKAFMEFIEKTGFTFVYLAYRRNCREVSIKIGPKGKQNLMEQK